MLGVTRARNAAGDRTLRIAAGQTGDQLINVMLVIVIAASIGFIGTDVNEKINSSVDIAENDTLRDAQDNLSSGYADAMGLSDIVFIVLMFSVILGALLVFRRRG